VHLCGGPRAWPRASPCGPRAHACAPSSTAWRRTAGRVSNCVTRMTSTNPTRAAGQKSITKRVGAFGPVSAAQRLSCVQGPESQVGECDRMLHPGPAQPAASGGGQMCKVYIGSDHKGELRRPILAVHMCPSSTRVAHKSRAWAWRARACCHWSSIGVEPPSLRPFGPKFRSVGCVWVAS
jgi:hypothetical protein